MIVGRIGQVDAEDRLDKALVLFVGSCEDAGGIGVVDPELAFDAGDTDGFGGGRCEH